MKKLSVFVGLAAVGAAALPSVNAQSMQAAAPAKWWNMSGELRGFYDDNYEVTHNKTGSFGFEVSPQLSANLDLQQTDIGIRYTYGMYYYVKRADNGQNPVDNTHQADLWLDHAFNSRVKLNVTDTFAVAQDPQLVQGGAVTRVGGNNVANHANVNLTVDWTRQFSTATYYQNELYIYSNSSGTNNVPPGTNPSSAALLNRIDQRVGTDLQWHFQPETMGFVGYAYSWSRYTGNAEIVATTPPPLIKSDTRNYNAQYMYVGANHVFTPSLSASGRAGATYVDSYNQSSTSWAPYADVSATYTYVPGSFVQLGFRQDINATDVAAPSSNGQLTQYQQSSVFYGAINHEFTPKLHGSATGQYQFSKYQDGAYGGQGDNDVNAGVNLTYQFNSHVSANVGYNFNELFSNIPGRDYSRNVVYFGLGASY